MYNNFGKFPTHCVQHPVGYKPTNQPTNQKTNKMAAYDGNLKLIIGDV